MDLLPVTISADGKVYQNVYAQKAADKSATCAAACCKEGIVFVGSRLRTSPLEIVSFTPLIREIDEDVLCLATNTYGDGLAIQSELCSQTSSLNRQMSISEVAKAASRTFWNHTMLYHHRNYASNLFIGGIEKRPQDITNNDSAGVNSAYQLYTINTSGQLYKVWGGAIGEHRNQVTTAIEKLPLHTLSCSELVEELVKLIYVATANKREDVVFDISYVTDITNEATTVHLDDAQLSEVISKAKEYYENREF